MKQLTRLIDFIFLLLAGGAVLYLLASCKTVSVPVCKHTIMLPVTVQKDSNTYYTIDLPFCDTISLVPKKIK